jgi:hypothetical protein
LDTEASRAAWKEGERVAVASSVVGLSVVDARKVDWEKVLAIARDLEAGAKALVDHDAVMRRAVATDENFMVVVCGCEDDQRVGGWGTVPQRFAMMRL